MTHIHTHTHIRLYITYLYISTAVSTLPTYLYAWGTLGHATEFFTSGTGRGKIYIYIYLTSAAYDNTGWMATAFRHAKRTNRRGSLAGYGLDSKTTTVMLKIGARVKLLNQLFWGHSIQ